MEKVYDPIYAYELIDRWSCQEWLLNRLHGDHVLTPYRCLGVRIDPDSMRKVAFGERILGPVFVLDVGESLQDVVYPLGEVQDYEKYHPEILWKNAEESECVDKSRNDGTGIGFIDSSTSIKEMFASSNGVSVKEGTNLATSHNDNGYIVDRSECEWIPAEEVRKLLRLSPIQFVSMLNAGAVETSDEQGRRDFAEKFGYALDEVPYFKVQNLKDLYVFRFSFEWYIENPPVKIGPFAPPMNIMSSYSQFLGEIESDDVDFNKRIVELETLLAQVRQDNELLTSEVERLTAEKQAKPSKTAAAFEASQTSRVDEWKGHARVMAKVAYQCGLDDRKDLTRSDFVKMADKQGGLSKSAVELLREALPDVAKKSPGAPRQV